MHMQVQLEQRSRRRVVQPTVDDRLQRQGWLQQSLSAADGPYQVERLVTRHASLSLSHWAFLPLTSSWPHLRCDVGLEEGEYKQKLSLCYSIVYYYNGAQRYEQFLQVSWLYRALILLGLALGLPGASVSSVLMVLYRYKKIFCLHPSLYLFVSWAWWDWPLTWLTNHCPSVLWLCWLGHVNRKTVSEMTYNVSSGALNSTVPYHTIGHFSRTYTTGRTLWTFELRSLLCQKNRRRPLHRTERHEFSTSTSRCYNWWHNTSKSSMFMITVVCLWRIR